MRILIIRNYPTYLDVENRTYNIQELGLAKSLIRKGHECDLLFWTNKNEKTVLIPFDGDKKVKIIYKKGVTFLKNTIFKGCSKLFDKYDILQPCEYNQFQSYLLAKKYPSKVFIYHGPYYSSFNKKYNLMCSLFDLFFLKKYIQLGTHFISKSSLSTDFLLSKKIKKENISTIGVGVDLDFLSDECANSNNDIFQSGPSTKFLYVGRIEPRRNILFLLETFKELKKSLHDCELCIIGTGDKKYVSKVKEYIFNNRLMESVQWIEKMKQNQLGSIYEKSDIFLLPTSYEIYGMVLLESMYYKNVVFTTLNGGSIMLIKNGENGVIIDSLNSKLWADQICNVVVSDKTRIMKENAHLTIKDGFTWDVLSEHFIDAYSKSVKLN